MILSKFYKHGSASGVFTTYGQINSILASKSASIQLLATSSRSYMVRLDILAFTWPKIIDVC